MACFPGERMAPSGRLASRHLALHYSKEYLSTLKHCTLGTLPNEFYR
jgi:hypothetical protein